MEKIAVRDIPDASDFPRIPVIERQPVDDPPIELVVATLRGPELEKLRYLEPEFSPPRPAELPFPGEEV
jgi:hypothetical protein